VQDTTNVANLQAAVSTNGAGDTVVTLTFTTTGNASTEIDPVSAQNGGAPSLADGRYKLTVMSADVKDGIGDSLNGGSNYASLTDTPGGGPGELGLFRLFGDANGDGVVDDTDLGALRSTYNASIGSAEFLYYFDSDNSGTVDDIDLGQFRVRFNLSVF